MLIGERDRARAVARRGSDRPAREDRRPTGPWRTIVGIVGDVRHQALAAPPTMQMYMPQAQVTDSYSDDGDARRAATPQALAAEARRANLVGGAATCRCTRWRRSRIWWRESVGRGGS